jgi:hypothetical protein
MKKLSYILVASAFAISGVFAVLSKQTPSRVSRSEVPERSPRGPASSEDPSTSQPAPLSIRPSPEATAGLKITESQIRMMEDNLSELQQDVSLFKDSQGWIVRFHQPSGVMASLGVKDNELISFKLIQDMKNEPALTALVGRLEIIFAQLQK